MANQRKTVLKCEISAGSISAGQGMQKYSANPDFS